MTLSDKCWEELQKSICSEFDIDTVLFQTSNLEQYRRPRQMTMKAIYDLTNEMVSQRTIGDLFYKVRGKPYDHATITNARSTISNLYNTHNPTHVQYNIVETIVRRILNKYNLIKGDPVKKSGIQRMFDKVRFYIKDVRFRGINENREVWDGSQLRTIREIRLAEIKKINQYEELVVNIIERYSKPYEI